MDPGEACDFSIFRLRLKCLGKDRNLVSLGSAYTASTTHIPITGVDCPPATLLIDTQAPLDVLYETAAYRIRAVTQLLENIAFREELSSDAVVLHDFALLLAIPLRDGCDVLDVIGRRLQAQAMA